MFNSPLSLAKADQIIEQLALAPGAHVLDVGCGDGAFLRRVAARYEIAGLGIDLDAAAIERAQSQQQDGVGFVVGDGVTFSAETP